MTIQTTQQARLQDDLRGLVSGQVRCDDIVAQLYSTDAGPFEIRPIGVVWPRCAADVSAVVRYCSEENIPVHPRGSGTSSAGGALGPGIVLDFTRHMKRLLHAEGDTVLVQPGAIRERLNDILKRSTGRFFAPSSSFLPTDTIGGIISSDVAGPRWLKYGFPHEFVEELEIVTADGTISTLLPVEIQKLSQSGLPQQLLMIPQLIADASHAIQIEQTQNTPSNAGYCLSGVTDQSTFYPTRLFAGCEGSLGIITKLRVRTSVRATLSGGAFLLFDSLEKAAEAVPFVLKSEPALCELIDRRTVRLMCEKDSRFVPFLPMGTEYALLVELHDVSPASLGERLHQLVYLLRYKKSLIFGSFMAQAPEEFAVFSQFLKNSELALLALGSGVELITLFEDLWVPVSALPEFLAETQLLLRKHDLVYSIGGHLGQGHIRIILIVDLNHPISTEKINEIAGEICSKTVHFGGSFGSARDWGMARTQFLPSCSPQLFPVFEQIKRLLDPQGILNPQTAIFLPENERFFPRSALTYRNEVWKRSLRGEKQKDIYSEASAKHSKNSVFSVDESDDSPVHATSSDLDRPGVRSQLETQFDWNRHSFDSDVYGCTGCGLCRIRTGGLRMCPSFRHEPEEKSSCRAKANVLRGVLDGRLSLETMSENALREIGERCIGCHCCKSECPTGIDIPKLSYRIRSAYAEAHGLAFIDKIISNLDILLHLGISCRCLFTHFQKAKTVRWFFEKMLGITYSRSFPTIVRRRFLRQRHSISHSIRRPAAKAVLFIDLFSDCYDTVLPEAASAVLQHNNVDLIIPPRQKPSGHLSFAVGDMPRAERLARINTRVLIDYVRQGYRIVTLEPISAISLSREYLWQLDNSETRAVAEKTTDLCSFLLELHREGKLDLNLNPLPRIVGYHAPCRTLALVNKPVDVPTPAEEILRLIPRLNVRRLERGCCGLAGPSGFKKENHMASLMLGMPLFLALRDPSIEFGATECNFCRLQMEQGTEKKVYHPVKLLAHSYRLLQFPQLE